MLAVITGEFRMLAVITWRISQGTIVITLHAQWFLLDMRVERFITDLINSVCANFE